MYRFLIIAGLELYALSLAWVQSLGGIRTDEAKYLLDIPYPHPPLIRWIMSTTQTWPLQESLWRIFLASLVVQAAWLVWDMTRARDRSVRMMLCGAWLFSAAVVLQAGSIMMAPITALQALVLVWIFLRVRDATKLAGIIGLFWLASLFTAYQALLFVPLVYAMVRRMELPQWKQVSIIIIPLITLCLYTASNPLAFASMLNAGSQNAGLEVWQSIHGVLQLWMYGGSLILSIFATVVMIRERQLPILLSMLLVMLYVCISYRFYYAVLFTPLFVGALAYGKSLAHARVLSWLFVLCTLLFVWVQFPVVQSSVASEVAEQLPKEGVLLIQGSFGHEWQYESMLPVERYREEAIDTASAIVCLQECELDLGGDWRLVEDAPVLLWIRRMNF